MSQVNSRGNVRRKALLDLLAVSGRLTVSELSRDLGISEVSVRRELEQMERLGLLRRVRGAAEAIAGPGFPTHFEARLLQNRDLKAVIGRTAAALIRSGESVLLDSGSTVLEVARHIPQPLLETGGLTIITRSLVIASELRGRRQTRLIVLGGLYLHQFDDFVGPSVEAALSAIRADTLFIGTDGVSAERGFTTDNVLEAGLYRAMTRAARRVVLVTDSSKISVDRLQTTLSFEDVHTFITDSAAPVAFTDLLRSRGVEVILAEEPQPAARPPE